MVLDANNTLRRPAIIAFVILLVGILFSLIIYSSVQNQAKLRSQLKFDTLTADGAQKVQERMRYFQSTIMGIKGLFEASSNVTPDEWENYISATNLFVNQGEITGVGYTPKITPKTIKAYEKQRSADLGKKFAIFPTGQRPYYFPLHFTSTQERRPTRILGFDTTSEPNRRAATLRAIETNEPSLTAPINLVEDTTELSVAMYIPILAQVNGPIQRSKSNVHSPHVRGTITAVVRMADFMAKVLGTQDFYSLSVFDTNSIEEKNLLYRGTNDDTVNDYDVRYTSQQTINIGGRDWVLQFSSRPAFVGFSDSGKALTFLVSALLVSLLVAAIVFILFASRERIRVRERRFRLITEKSNDVTLVLDKQLACTYLSDSGHKMLHIQPEEISRVRFGNYLENGDKTELQAQLHKATSTPERAIALRPFTVHISDHETAELDGTITFTNSMPDLGHYVINCRDVSTIKGLEIQLQQMALYDSLTGLANRKLLIDRLEGALHVTHTQPVYKALLYIDLDNFKQVNDRLGHIAGDQLLKVIARRLKNAVRATDTVARIGGDEFNILLNDMASMDDARLVAQHVVESVSQPVPLFDTEVFPSCSVGLAPVGKEFAEAEEVMRAADLAMYEMKRNGKSGVVEYDENMSANQRSDMAQLEAIRAGIQNNEFILHFQPKFNIKTREICGLEALVRWQDSRGNLLAPIEFVPLCERYHLINELGDYVLERGIKQLANFLQQGLEVPISINVAVSQITSGNLHTQLEDLLQQYQVDPSYIELEITESMLIDNVSVVALALKRVKSLGVSLAIDDFGAGFSGLNHLKSLPIDVVKIDSSYVNDIPDSAADTEIVSAVITMSHALNLTVVAEGIETEQQLECLVALDCDYGQGFWYSKALSANDILQTYKK